MNSIRDQVEAIRKTVFEKEQFKKSIIKAHARLTFISWLDFVVRKSHSSETGYYLNLWKQEPQYFILFKDNNFEATNRICEVPVFLTELEEDSLKADFDSAIKFGNEDEPTLEDVKRYNSVIGAMFKAAIKYDEVRYCPPVKFYTFAGFVIDLDDATHDEIERFNKPKVQTESKPQKSLLAKFFQSLYC
jgi:hypothetical protein